MTRWLKRRSQIVGEWDRWAERQHIGRRGLHARETLKFYTELQNAKSPLLDFNSRGRDKWKIVHDWLLAAGRVID